MLFQNCSGGWTPKPWVTENPSQLHDKAGSLNCPPNYSYQNGVCTPPANGGSFQTRIGIIYSLWHCPTKSSTGAGIYDNTLILAGRSSYGPVGSWDWWGKPALGYYCLTERPDVLRQHAIELRDAGIEYVVIDVTNWPDIVNSDRAQQMIQGPFAELLSVWSQIPGAPRVVPWVPVMSLASYPNPMADWVLNELSQFPSMEFIEEGRPFFLVAANPSLPIDTAHLTQLAQSYSYREMWIPNGQANLWAFNDICPAGTSGACNQFIAQNNGPEQISISTAVNRFLMSVPSQSLARKGGQTFISQFATLFNNPTTRFAIIDQWNEWLAIHMCFDSSGNVTYVAAQCAANSPAVFVDQYVENYSRDIEPNSYASGDLYYRQMKACVANFRRGEPCDINSSTQVTSITNVMDASLPNAVQRACTYPSEGNIPSTSAVNQIAGYVDGLSVSGSSVLLSGWACSTGFSSSIQVQVFAGGPAGSGTLLGTYNANLPSEAAVDGVCQTFGIAHRYQIDITDFMNSYPGQRLYVHGLNPVTKINYFLTGSGHCAVPWPETLAGQTVANSCVIKGGAGLLLYSGNLTQSDCNTQCQTFDLSHPNLTCMWGSTDLAPVSACTITGGAGLGLYSAVVSHGQCYSECLSLFTSHPNLSCLWQTADLAPTGRCSITAANGAISFAGIDTHGQCYNQCKALLPTQPGESCAWNSAPFSLQ